MAFKSVVPVNAIRDTGMFINIRSGGGSNISAKAVELLGLKHGDCFNVVEDEAVPGDYYIVKTNQAGFSYKKYLGVSGKSQHTFHARSLARAIGRKFGVGHKSIKLNIGPKIEKYNETVWPLITAALKFEVK